MNFDFEPSRVDCISNENYFLYFNIKMHLNLLKHPPFPPLFSGRKTLSAGSTPMHLVYKNKLLFRLSVDNALLTHVDHLIGGLLSIVNKKRYDTTWCHINTLEG